jgi:hypothetical protein
MKEFVNLLSMSASNCFPKFSLENVFANSLVALILSPHYLNVNILQCVLKVAVSLVYGRFRFRPVSTLVDITPNTFYKCTGTFRTQVYRKCLRIKLNGFRPAPKLVEITSSNFCLCTANFRTHCITSCINL